MNRIAVCGFIRLKVSSGIRLFAKNPHPQGWGYTDEARLRGLIQQKPAPLRGRVFKQEKTMEH
jgi:hypothetical protein